MGYYLNQALRTPIEPVLRDEIGPERYSYPDCTEWLAMSVWPILSLLLYFVLGWGLVEIACTWFASYCVCDDPWDRE